jgi:hypothetical protein
MPVHIGFAVDRVALGQVFFRVLQSYLISIVQLVLHVYSLIFILFIFYFLQWLDIPLGA